MAKFSHLNIPTEWEQYWSKYPEGYTMLEALIDWTGQVDEMVDYINAGTDTEGNTIDLSQYLKKEDFELYLITSTTIAELKDNAGSGGGTGEPSDVFTPINAMLQEWGYSDFPEFIAGVGDLTSRVSSLEYQIQELQNAE